ncbi:1-acyl-sn-glycerol-3-phosphate acyltransferase [Mechercharimyces sp. CAU 1602]|uniref:lysophospholipid acyltransferase family protein n=1 Tax=Mechercharimyces sp. CAU 1602 TaxID=2973933 RepID=UPI0021621D2A|nr:lysophospholipid acyltransferase family protein [Mechercharimyces sp. CAU 1602]MCS1352681.1 1-acyl-sn-glycerol-3-phosphate acyltransferase [Mechercharimyces sp. CAU 1602]
MLYGFGKGLILSVLALYHRVDIEGKHHIPKEGSFLLVGNHVSYLDPFYIGATVPRQIKYMAKKESFDHPVTRWFLQQLDAFSVDRSKPDMGAIRTALKHLKDGNVVGMFPEGTRSDEGLSQLKQGAAYLAIRSKSPIIPVHISGTDRCLPRGKTWIRPAKVRIAFGEPIQIEEGKGKDLQEKVSQHILTALQSLAPQMEARTES